MVLKFTRKYKVKRVWRFTVPISPGEDSIGQQMEISSSLKSLRGGRGASAKKNKRCPDPTPELEL